MTTELPPHDRSDGIGDDANDTAAALIELERAEILVHTRYPDPGVWYPLGMAVYAGSFITSIALPPIPRFLVWAATLVAAMIGVSVYTKRRGATPDAFKAPAPLRREMIAYGVAACILAAGLAGLWQVAAWWAVAVTGMVVTYVGTDIYARRFKRAAMRIEAEAGIEPMIAA